jgi:hypothetical protein
MATVTVILDAGLHRFIKLNQQLCKTPYSIISTTSAGINYLEVTLPGAAVRKIPCDGIYTPPKSAVVIVTSNDKTQQPICDADDTISRIVEFGRELSADKTISITLLSCTNPATGVDEECFLVTDKTSSHKILTTETKIPPNTGSLPLRSGKNIK